MNIYRVDDATTDLRYSNMLTALNLVIDPERMSFQQLKWLRIGQGLVSRLPITCSYMPEVIRLRSACS